MALIIARFWLEGIVCPWCTAKKIHAHPRRGGFVFCFGCGRWDDAPALVAAVKAADAARKKAS